MVVWVGPTSARPNPFIFAPVPLNAGPPTFPSHHTRHMSLHLFSNLQVDDTLYATTVQAHTTTGLALLSSAGTQTVQVQDSGFVGIGQASPVSLLHALGSNAQMTLENADAGTLSAAQVSLRTPGQDWHVQNRAGTLQIVDETGTTTRLTLSTAGDLVLTGQQHVVSGGAQKLTIVGVKSITGLTGANATALFSVGLPQNAHGGVKAYVTLTSTTHQAVKFEEYVAQVVNGSASGASTVYQASSLPASTLSDVVSWTSGALTIGSLTAGAAGSLTAPFSYSFVQAGSNPGTTNVSFVVEAFGASGAVVTV